MARQALPVQSINTNGIEPTANDAHADGHAFYNNNGRTVITVINDSADEDVTLVITPQDTRDGLAREAKEIAVPFGEKRIVGGLPADVYEIQGGADHGKVYIDFADGDVITDVTIEAVTL